MRKKFVNLKEKQLLVQYRDIQEPVYVYTFNHSFRSLISNISKQMLKQEMSQMNNKNQLIE